MSARAAGDAFEDRALEHLQRAGLKLLARNFATRFGELDLVMRDADSVVFVEVRYRRHLRFGGGAASVGAAKRERIVRAAHGFLQANPKWSAMPCRFDVVAFDGDARAAECDWIKAAFEI